MLGKVRVIPAYAKRPMRHVAIYARMMLFRKES